MQRTLVALWFADIAGYSAHAAEDECGALRLVEILQALSRETVARHKGRVVKFVGDAVLAEFPSAELAVRSAAALSKEYTEQSDMAIVVQPFADREAPAVIGSYRRPHHSGRIDFLDNLQSVAFRPVERARIMRIHLSPPTSILEFASN